MRTRKEIETELRQLEVRKNERIANSEWFEIIVRKEVLQWVLDGEKRKK